MKKRKIIEATHTCILLSDKNEKGSIAIYVIVSLIFLTIILISMLAASKNSLITALKIQENINNIYENDVASADQIYEQNKTKLYTIIYDSNGGIGTMEDSIFTKNVESNLRKNTYTKVGYEFDGWKDQGNNTYGDEQPVTFEKDLTLTAQWKNIEYQISYYDEDGSKLSTQNPKTYTIDTETFTLNNPSKEGYVFTGWTGTGLTEPSKTVTIEKKSMGNRTYTANWLVLYKVTINLDGVLRYGAEGSDTVNTTLNDSKENIDIYIYYTKNGINKIEKSGSNRVDGIFHAGPRYHDWWSSTLKYKIVWKLYNAKVTKDDIENDTDVTIPICITGKFGYGKNGSETINTHTDSYNWNVNINIPKDGDATLSSTGSGEHRNKKSI